MGTVYDIESVVPHRGTLRLVDRLLGHGEDWVEVEARVRGDGPFLEPAGMPGWVGIEYMAQAIAAWAGCRARERGEPPRMGFLLGTRRYACTVTHFAPGARLRIRARCELLADNGLGSFACTLLEDDRELATANVSVFEPADPAAFLAATGDERR